jgi:hypothetical protein
MVRPRAIIGSGTLCQFFIQFAMEPKDLRTLRAFRLGFQEPRAVC